VSFYEFVILSIKIVATGGRKVNRRKPVKCKEKRGADWSWEDSRI
jgi:hypothetical protein